MALGAGQAKGPFKPAPGLRFPMKAGAVGSMAHYVGSRKAEQQGSLQVQFVLPGWAAVYHGHRATSLQELLL